MKLARVDVVAPTLPATPDQAVAVLKESIQDVGFEVTVKSLLLLVSQLIDPLRLFEGDPWWPNSGPQR